ncbi:TRAP transporter small permease [Piscinibacter sakaiensis]|uniref:TRAP transporter small permease n=1 Tax=Piscinibacter sakaiensis TaxID=1547922 RepID=UPI003AAF9BE0
MKPLQSTHRFISALETVCGWAASACLFAIMVTVFVDVGMRYLLNSPLGWSYDLISLYLMVALFFLALSVTQRDRHHVRVDILLGRVSPPARHAMELIGNLLTALVMLAIFYQGSSKVMDSWQTQAVIAGPIPWPTWLTAVFVPIGTALLLLRLLFSVWALAVAIANRSATAVGESNDAGRPLSTES